MEYIQNQHAGRQSIEEGSIQYLKNKFNIESAIDIGCGIGGMVDQFHKMEIDAIGIDGDETCKKDKVFIHDYSKGPIKELPDKVFDLAYSTEVLEHIDDAYVDNIMETFKKCKYALITAAPIGWKGVGHVNEQSHYYWLKVFNKHGFILDTYNSIKVRQCSTLGWKASEKKGPRKMFLRHRGLFFINVKYTKIKLTEYPGKSKDYGAAHEYGIEDVKENVFYKLNSTWKHLKENAENGSEIKLHKIFMDKGNRPELFKPVKIEHISLENKTMDEYGYKAIQAAIKNSFMSYYFKNIAKMRYDCKNSKKFILSYIPMFSFIDLPLENLKDKNEEVYSTAIDKVRGVFQYVKEKISDA